MHVGSSGMAIFVKKIKGPLRKNTLWTKVAQNLGGGGGGKWERKPPDPPPVVVVLLITDTIPKEPIKIDQSLTHCDDECVVCMSYGQWALLHWKLGAVHVCDSELLVVPEKFVKCVDLWAGMWSKALIASLVWLGSSVSSDGSSDSLHVLRRVLQWEL